MKKPFATAWCLGLLALTQCTRNEPNRNPQSAADSGKRIENMPATAVTGVPDTFGLGGPIRKDIPVSVENMSQSHVRRVQEALNSHGFELDTDGVAGPATHAAIRRFQHEESIAGNGTLTTGTLDKLGLPAAEFVPAE